MSTTTSNFLLQVKDKEGNMYILYPITTVENVDGLTDALILKADLDEDGKVLTEQLPDMDYLPLTGGTVTGEITATKFKINSGTYFQNNNIIFNGGQQSISVGGQNDPMELYTDSGKIDVCDSLILHVATPVNDTDAANKSYVDTAIQTAIGDAIAASY